ncbi:acetyl-CoA carboxylase biotin carboxyl carrier protein [Sporosarcina sp. G11-34]|uniref:acetyl-CoA carboxylase biotin carboxyl carrier protein n=1 Tax=Sporosarcina sp. G11-34 TaxID=2849605 RepID=UPI0022A99F4F|nr:acetyl-CoA carboxylase biotin carboxyl carrier protein [Sporosarcina sp. G11-34]MCZ2260107.1 acetyl-CoA carboxylase biotin carboxyl carrier protein [Sporosarcina sp. G11-34]
MLKIQEIREIIKLIDQSSIEKFTFESEGTKIVLKKGGSEKTVVPSVVETAPVVQQVLPVVQEQVVAAPKQAVQAAPEEKQVEEDASLHKVTSPMVGTFYASASPEVPAYVQVGAKVTEESIVCIVEAMKLFNEIEAEVSGEIVKVLVEDGQLVEYGQPLFLVKAN